MQVIFLKTLCFSRNTNLMPPNVSPLCVDKATLTDYLVFSLEIKMVATTTKPLIITEEM